MYTERGTKVPGFEGEVLDVIEPHINESARWMMNADLNVGEWWDAMIDALYGCYGEHYPLPNSLLDRIEEETQKMWYEDDDEHYRTLKVLRLLREQNRETSKR